ncbi:MAG: hypothetical protein R3B95_09905 [Nitrospirales bacterium]|nr:transposase [Nitrospirales bacterium]
MEEADLVRGVDRSELSLDLFYQWLAVKKTAGLKLAVMDMWRAFETSTVKQCAPGGDPV